MSYTEDTYRNASNKIPIYFKNLKTFRGQKLYNYEVCGLRLVRGFHVENVPPQGAVAILWVWCQYTTTEIPFATVGHHCFLGSDGHRIQGLYDSEEFVERVDMWLQHVRDKTEALEALLYSSETVPTITEKELAEIFNT